MLKTSKADTLNPLSPNRTIPVPVATGTDKSLLRSADVVIPPIAPPVSYIAPEALNTTEFRCGQSPNLNPGSGVNMPAKRNMIELFVSSQLPYRSIYARILTSSFAANYYIRLRLEFWSNGSSVGWLPLGAAGGINTGDVVPSICITGGTVGIDSIVTIENDGTNVILQPYYIYNSVDRITVSIDSSNGVEDCFVWVGVVSSKQR
jgi:hypothetical protein